MAAKLRPPFGTPLVFTYGEPTGFFVGENEMRIGHEPQGYRPVLSTRRGEFPIRPLLIDGVEQVCSDHAAALAMVKQVGKPMELALT